jgi:hypothetical protein
LPSQQPFGQLVALQMHWPPLHACPAPQTWLHEPQLSGSVCSFTHAPLHR